MDTFPWKIYLNVMNIVGNEHYSRRETIDNVILSLITQVHQMDQTFTIC